MTNDARPIKNAALEIYKCNANFCFFFDLPDDSSSSSFLGDMGVLTRNYNRNYSLES